MRQKLQSPTFFFGEILVVELRKVRLHFTSCSPGCFAFDVSNLCPTVPTECSHDQCRDVSSQKADKNFGGTPIYLMINCESSTVKFL